MNERIFYIDNKRTLRKRMEAKLYTFLTLTLDRLEVIIHLGGAATFPQERSLRYLLHRNGCSRQPVVVCSACNANLYELSQILQLPDVLLFKVS
jgi:hypothetical protein